MTNGTGRLIGNKYRLREVLGEGGLAVVWRAHDESLGRDVAIKEVRPPRGIHADQVTSLYMRTLREARAAAKLANPGIVVVHEVVHEDDRPWIVMELIRGRTLQQVIEENGPQPPWRAAELGGKILTALRAVHRAGIVHRDIKPSNVMFDGERIVLTDFGIAALDGSTILTMTGTVLGTPAYMSPEQAHGRHVTPASDLWSLGATLYATVEGHPPFEGKSVAAVLAALLANKPAEPVRAGPLGPVIAALMVTDPGQRMSADELAIRLSHVASGGDGTGPIAATPGTRPDIGPYAPRFGSPQTAPGRPHPSALDLGGGHQLPRHDDPTIVRRRRPKRTLAVIGAAVAIAAVTAGVITTLATRSSGHSPTPPARSHAAGPNKSAAPVVHLGTRFPSTQLSTGTNIYSVAFSPDGKTLAAGASNHTVLLYDPRRHVQTAQLPGHTNAIDQVAFSPDGKQLATASDDKTIRLWDLASGTQTAVLTGHTSYVWSVDFSPDGKTLASGSKDGTIRVWDVASHKLIRIVRGHTDGVVIVKFSPDGKTLASGSWDNTVRLWDTSSWRQAAVLRGHTDAVHSVVFSPDGKTLATGAEDAKVLLWNLATRTQTAVLTGQTKEIWSIALSPDGKTLASAGADHKIVLYDMTTGAEIATLSGHKAQVDWIAFSPDGKTLASGAEDKSIRLWDLTR